MNVSIHTMKIDIEGFDFYALKGMNEVDASFELPSALSDVVGIKKKIYEVANVVQVPSALEAGDAAIKFAGRTVATSSLVLLSLFTHVQMFFLGSFLFYYLM